MALRVCTVGFKAPTGISHSVEVSAETLMEAAGYGLALLKKDGWIEGLGPGTRLEITVREPATHHTISVSQFERWLKETVSLPGDVLRRAKLKQALGVK
jgi:hypothetical protein